MFYKAGIWILLVACGSAFNIYGESQPFDIDTEEQLYDLLQDYNSEHDPNGLKLGDLAAKNPMLLKIFIAMHEMEDGVQYKRPKFRMVDSPINMPTLELLDVKDGPVKRNAIAIQDSSSAADTKNKPMVAEQPKKDDYTFSPWLCYLKLCTYPRPHPVQ